MNKVDLEIKLFRLEGKAKVLKETGTLQELNDVHKEITSIKIKLNFLK